VADKYRFEEPDQVGFVCRGLQHRGEYVFRVDGKARGEGVGREAFVNTN
jgi:hypothetical protein